MTKLLTSTWATVSIGIVLYLGTTVFFWKTPSLPAPVADHPLPLVNKKGPSWDFVSPEADQLIAELKSGKEAIAKREQQLNELAARLAAERLEINQATQAVYQAQLDFDKMVLRVKEGEVANLKKLAKVYSAMSPEGAASIFSEMNSESIVKILLFMKESDTAAILENLGKKGDSESKRAVEISESLRVSVYRPTASK